MAAAGMIRTGQTNQVVETVRLGSSDTLIGLRSKGIFTTTAGALIHGVVVDIILDPKRPHENRIEFAVHKFTKVKEDSKTGSIIQKTKRFKTGKLLPRIQVLASGISSFVPCEIL